MEPMKIDLLTHGNDVLMQTGSKALVWSRTKKAFFIGKILGGDLVNLRRFADDEGELAFKTFMGVDAAQTTARNLLQQYNDGAITAYELVMKANRVKEVLRYLKDLAPDVVEEGEMQVKAFIALDEALSGYVDYLFRTFSDRKLVPTRVKQLLRHYAATQWKISL